ncbi:hypothetical protein [Flavobacterium sp. N2155]|uniref:hypothetical protein n=2 Tax=unclassified Flavobacterium TaxID=196869 RepID=UPI002224775D|nr:hypothetical protein [Flavobacterium sp. N2155]
MMKKSVVFMGLVMALIMVVVVPLLAYLFTHKSWIIDLTDKNELGDAIGGTTAPIIGICSVVFTFMAFYIQYEFNKRQNEILKLQVKINIRQSLEPYFIYLIDSLKKFKLENNSNKKIAYNGDYIEPQNQGDLMKLKYQVSNVFVGIMDFKASHHTIKNLQLSDLFVHEKQIYFDEHVIDEYVFHVNTVFKFLSYNIEIDNGEDKNEIIEEFLFKYLSSLSINEIYFNSYYLMIFHTDFAIACKKILLKSIENLPADRKKTFLTEVYHYKIAK